MSTHLQTCVGVQGQDFVFFKHSLCNFTKLEGMCVVYSHESSVYDNGLN